MTEKQRHDAWDAGQSYETYMGRWSARIAETFLDWLAPPKGADWIDVGCGTGALSRTILARTNPASVVGIEPSPGFVAHARALTPDDRARFCEGGAEALPLPDASCDVAASALVLNFVPDRVKALGEMRRVLRPGRLLGFYVWDYPGGGMGFIDAFWKAAAALDPAAAELDEAVRFPFCTRDGIAALCREAGIKAEVTALEVETVFDSFEDFFSPFTLGAGPAPGYLASLPLDGQAALRQALAAQLDRGGAVRLTARAWAARARM
ncbi:class I SAM-dependent methyltransferase [Shimia biformata]|uniref:class I SAM-dependent methyltransferase n=1 Tax=Shimia biformata TaxID=1294299 RepID=UPI00194DECC8|nr:class I SAM-dependent methyltransferase [Shimia biformata]